MPVIDIQQVKRRHPLGDSFVDALKGVDFQANKGEFVVLMGASGSGKSSLLSIIGAMDEATSGQVFIAGKNLSSLNDRQKSQLRRDHIGFIFQSFNLIAVLTALENVMYPLSLQKAKNAKARATIALQQVGLGDFLQHRPTQLSGGQIQRVAIARALVTNPAVILADEPTANLDSKNSTQIIQLMKTLSQEQGLTFILATHDESIIQSATRVVELKDGLLIKDVSKNHHSENAR
ncbi:MAG: ABC transporter ATP-binding protein [Bermanella sp.]